MDRYRLTQRRRPIRMSAWVSALPEARQPPQIRLQRPRDQYSIRAARTRLAQVELELAHLVPSEGASGAVLALDPKLDAERPAQVRGGVERVGVWPSATFGKPATHVS